jgi:hypothetical protein
LQGTGVTDTGILLTKGFIWKFRQFRNRCKNFCLGERAGKNKDICNDVLLLLKILCYVPLMVRTFFNLMLLMPVLCELTNDMAVS